MLESAWCFNLLKVDPLCLKVKRFQKPLVFQTCDLRPPTARPRHRRVRLMRGGVRHLARQIHGHAVCMSKQSDQRVRVTRVVTNDSLWVIVLHAPVSSTTPLTLSRFTQAVTRTRGSYEQTVRLECPRDSCHKWFADCATHHSVI